MVRRAPLRHPHVAKGGAAVVAARVRTCVAPAARGLPDTCLGTRADELAADSAALRRWRLRLPHREAEAVAQEP